MTQRAKVEVAIEEENCLGCGYCELFCPHGCLVLSKEKLNSKGYSFPIFINPTKCTACGTCATMCPEFVIKVYRIN